MHRLPWRFLLSVVIPALIEPHRSSSVDRTSKNSVYAKFGESCLGEVRRISLPRTPVNRRALSSRGSHGGCALTRTALCSTLLDKETR